MRLGDPYEVATILMASGYGSVSIAGSLRVTVASAVEA